MCVTHEAGRENEWKVAAGMPYCLVVSLGTRMTPNTDHSGVVYVCM